MLRLQSIYHDLKNDEQTLQLKVEQRTIDLQQQNE